MLGGLDIEEVEVLDRYLAKDTALQSVGLDVDNFRGIVRFKLIISATSKAMSTVKSALKSFDFILFDERTFWIIMTCSKNSS